MSTGGQPPIQKRLSERVADWLHTEGYPLEFATAAEFRKHGFHVRQGQHVRDKDSSVPREIDVLADQTHDLGGAFVRLHHVVECKYSHDKPWVVFTSVAGGISPAACVAQTIGSKAGEALLWAIAGDPAVHSLSHFAVPERPGFGGRQAFAKGQDLVYSALQSVTSLSTLVVRRYAEGHRRASQALAFAAVAFPVVVVDGELFESYLDPQTGDLVVKEANQLRLHWKGSEAWPLHATIDIVRFSALGQFAERRSKDGQALLLRLAASFKELRQSFSERKPKLFTVTNGSRGLATAPQLLIDLRHELRQGAKGRRMLSPGI